MRPRSTSQRRLVIEGYVDPKEPLRDEGPFGDHTGYYTLPSPHGIAGSFGRKIAHGVIPRGEPYPVFHVTAITHRKDAVYPATIVGIPPMEDFYIGGVPRLRDETLPAHLQDETSPRSGTSRCRPKASSTTSSS